MFLLFFFEGMFLLMLLFFSDLIFLINSFMKYFFFKKKGFTTLFDCWSSYEEAIRYRSSRMVLVIATVRGVATSPKKPFPKATYCYAFVLPYGETPL